MPGTLQSRTSPGMTRSLRRLIRRAPDTFTAATADNGTEFHDDRAVERTTALRFHFAAPHHAWGRGCHEHSDRSSTAVRDPHCRRCDEPIGNARPLVQRRGIAIGPVGPHERARLGVEGYAIERARVARELTGVIWAIASLCQPSPLCTFGWSGERRRFSRGGSPEELFESAESLGKRLRVSRSRLYATALAEFLAKHQGRKVTDRLNRVRH